MATDHLARAAGQRRPVTGPTLATLDRPRAPERVTLAVVADPHVTPNASGTWKVYHRTERRLRAAVADVERRDVDCVVLAGDLTKDGAPSEFRAADAVLEELLTPLVGVPGNHDVPKPRWDPYQAPSAEEFARRYAAGTYPFVERVGGIDLVGGATAANAERVAAAYRETVMSVPHYDDDYGDSYPDSLYAEFGESVAVALDSGFDDPTKHGVLVAARDSQAERVRLVSALDERHPALATLADLGDLVASKRQRVERRMYA